jgi:hypothetical protein
VFASYSHAEVTRASFTLVPKLKSLVCSTLILTLKSLEIYELLTIKLLQKQKERRSLVVNIPFSYLGDHVFLSVTFKQILGMKL